MPDKETLKRARRDARQGKAASTQAGEFVREEIHHVREGKHGARSAKQAVAIGLSKARRAGVKLPPPPDGESTSSAVARKRGKKTTTARKRSGNTTARKRSSETTATRARAASMALKKEGKRGASHDALSRQARKSAAKRGPAKRHASAMKAVRTKGPATRSRAAKKAAATRRKAR